MKTKVLSSLLLTLVLISCRSVKESTSEYADFKTEKKSKVQVDSFYVYVSDSVITRTKGDTVYVEKWKIRQKEALHLRVDTVFKTDSTRTKTKVTKTTSTVIGLFDWAVIGVMIALLITQGISLFKK